MWGKIAGVALIVVAFFLYVTKFVPLGTIPLIPPSLSLTPLTASAIAAASTTLPAFASDGIYFADTQNTPFFLYETRTNKAAIKELVFGNSNACTVSAGGYSCVAPLYGTVSKKGNLSPGSVAYIEGGTEAQAIRVSSIAATSMPEGLREVQIASGDTATIGSLTISPGEALQNASCTLGEGCATARMLRVPVTLRNPAIHATELTVGAVYALGNQILILLSTENVHGTWTYTFAVADN